MKKIKILSTLMLSISALPLAACDMFGGGDEVDGKLYKLKLSCSENVTFDEEDLTAQLAFGEDGKGARDEYEIEELKKAGASDEDIAKVGTKQSDGYYYFFDQDPMFINVPTIEGYVLQGMYYKGTDERAFNPNYVDPNGNRSRWNMETKGADSIELEARYVALNYSVTYCYGIESGSDRTHSGLMPNGTHNNPANYDYGENKEVTLAAPTETIEGYEFKYWYYCYEGSPEKIECTKLPKVLDERFIHAMTYDSNGNPQYGLTLFAFYDLASYEVTFSIDEGVTATVTLITESGERTPLDISSGKVTVQYGCSLDVWVDTSEIYVTYPEMDHEFEGVYINGVKAPDIEYGEGLTRPCNRPDAFAITGDTTIEVKVKVVVPAV